MDPNATQPWGVPDLIDPFVSSSTEYSATQPFSETQAFVPENESYHIAGASEVDVVPTQPFSSGSVSTEAMWSQANASYDVYDDTTGNRSDDGSPQPSVDNHDNLEFQYDATQRFISSPNGSDILDNASPEPDSTAEPHVEGIGSTADIVSSSTDRNLAAIGSPHDDLVDDQAQILSQPQSPSSGDVYDAPQSPDADVDDEAGYYAEGGTQEFEAEEQQLADGPSSPNSISKSVRSDGHDESHAEIDPFLGVAELPSIDNLDDVPTADRLAATLDELEEGENSDAVDSSFHKKRQRVAAVDSDEESNKSEVVGIIRDIFGESDEEAGEFQGFDEKEAAVGIAGEAEPEAGLSDSEEPPNRQRLGEDLEYDFDIIMRKRKEEAGRRRRKRKDVDIINDSDELIQFLMEQMREAAREDRELNEQKKPALKKRKLLPHVLMQLRKQDLQSAFIDSGVVAAIMEWLSPLPDKSLPALEVRSELLKILRQFPPLHQDILKSSNIGKVVMYLYRHPKETKENRQIAGTLISEWARPIFNIQADFRTLTKEEREQRDYEHMPQSKKRRLSSDPDKRLEDTEGSTRPGEKGYIPRARVPRPSTKDYIIRPKWNVEGEFKKKSAQKKSSMLDKKMREFKERTKPNKTMRAVTVNISGNKMAL